MVKESDHIVRDEGVDGTVIRFCRMGKYIEGCWTPMDTHDET